MSLGELLGSDQGRALIDGVTTLMRDQGVVRSDRVVALFMPVSADR